MAARTSEPVQLFFCYAHEDEALRDQLDKQLSVLRREGLLASWHDRDIQAGTDWKQEIDRHLATASFILLLISPDFLTSDYCYNYEMQRAMERHQRGEARVIPVILRPCDWQDAPFGKLQALPRDGRAITSWPNLDQAFLEVERSLRKLLEQAHRTHGSSVSISVALKNRETMLLELRRLYLGLLAGSLQEAAWIDLSLAEQPGAVQNATNMILHRATQPTRPLPPGISLLQIYQEANQELLILGPPGAGKSTLLYQLGHDLLTRAEEQPTAPLPVLFPLSSWAEKRLPLGDWMVEQLVSPLYRVPRKQSQQWIANEQVLPLLDGLDEMEEDARPACISAINAYRNEHPLSPLVVCSRSAEYTTASTHKQGRLYLQSAIEVQRLSPAQLEAVLVQAGKPAVALQSELKKNAELRELARTPLWLNVLLLTFKNTSGRALSRQRSELQKQVCECYVQRMIEEKGQDKRYPPEQTKRWLSWLAGRMREQNLTAFAVEQLQPDWLARRPRMFYHWSGGLLYTLVLGLLFGQIAGLIYGLSIQMLYGLVFGLSLGLLEGLPYGLITGLINGSKPQITLVARLLGSRKKALPGLVFGLVYALVDGTICGVVCGVVFWVVSRMVSGLISGLIFGIVLGVIFGSFVGLVVGLFVGLKPQITLVERFVWSRKRALSGLVVGPVIGLVYYELVVRRVFTTASGLPLWLIIGMAVGLIFGLTPKQYIERHTSPGEGLRRSLRIGLLMGLIFGLVEGLLGWIIILLLFGLSRGRLQTDLIAGLLVGLLIGLGAVIQHFVLRFWLWRAGLFPVRAVAFLEDSCARHLLQRMGGSYRFVHRLLLDYFADLDSAR